MIRRSTVQLIREWGELAMKTSRVLLLSIRCDLHVAWWDRPVRKEWLDDPDQQPVVFALRQRRETLRRRLAANDWSESGLQLATGQDHADMREIENITAKLKELGAE